MREISKKYMQSISSAVLTLLVVAACSMEMEADLAQPGAHKPQQTHGQIDMDASSNGLHKERLPAVAEFETGTADETVPAKARMGYFPVSPAAKLRHIRRPSEPLNRENYAHFNDNPLQRVVDNPFSTFSIDVDTGAYSNLRRMLNAGNRPARDAVRTEELINYFSSLIPCRKTGPGHFPSPPRSGRRRGIVRPGCCRSESRDSRCRLRTCRRPIWYFSSMFPVPCRRPTSWNC